MRKLLPKILLIGLNNQLVNHSLKKQGYNVSILMNIDENSIIEYYDYLILDSKIFESGNYQILEDIKNNAYLRNTKIIALMTFQNDEILAKVTLYNLSDLIFKPFDIEELVARLKILDLKNESLSNNCINLPFKYDKHHKLTAREEDILYNISLGYSNKEIAGKLMLSEQTVKTHLRKIFFKLSVTNRLQAALVAIKEGIAI